MGFFISGGQQGGYMNTVNIKRFNVGRGKRTKHPLALTALWYLREALLNERYEQCAEFIQIAHEFGATPLEVKFLLEDARRFPNA